MPTLPSGPFAIGDDRARTHQKFETIPDAIPQEVHDTPAIVRRRVGVSAYTPDELTAAVALDVAIRRTYVRGLLVSSLKLASVNPSDAFAFADRVMAKEIKAGNL